MMDMTLKELERVLYFENFVVIDAGYDGAQTAAASDRRRILRSAG
jgi:hypothetical protein